MEWLLVVTGLVGAVMGFMGAVTGAAIPPLLQSRYSQETRRRDAYTSLAGAAEVLLSLSIPAQYQRVPGQDEAWVRFGVARARVMLEENDPTRLAAVRGLRDRLEALFSLTVYLEREPTEQERAENSVQHLERMERASEALEALLECVRDSHGDRSQDRSPAAVGDYGKIERQSARPAPVRKGAARKRSR